MDDKGKPKSKAPKIIGLIIIILVLIYLAILIPSLPGYRAKGFCARAEVDAHNIAAALSEYYAGTEHHGKVPSQFEIENLVDIKNPWKLTNCGENFYIHVIDRTGKCPAGYQKADADWNANIYTLKF